MTIRIEGAEELSRKLKALDKKVRRSYIRSAARAGSKLVQNEVTMKAPAPSGDETVLKDSIRLKLNQKESTTYSVLYDVGVGSEIFYAIMVEYGTKGVGTVRAAGLVTRQGGSSPGTRRVGGRTIEGSPEYSPKKTFKNRQGQFFKSFLHKGYSAKPFFRPAWESSKDDAIVEMGAVLKKRMGLK